MHCHEGNSLWKAFFSFSTYIFVHIWIVSAALGPGPDTRHVEMCLRVLITLRKMVNIKVFYKKVYNHLNIYTHTQIYIYSYIRIYFYNMAIEKSCNYVSNYFIINHAGSGDANNKACGSCFPPPGFFSLFLRLFSLFFADIHH